MAFPFILRFQEPFADPENMGVSGTQTMTNVRAEHMDSDPDGRRYGALGAPTTAAGTRTKTAVSVEATDDDRTFSALRAVPAALVHSAGTRTMTRAKGESADEDPGGRRARVIPACSLS